MARASDGATGSAVRKPARSATPERSAARQGRAPQSGPLVQAWKNAQQYTREVIAELNRVSWPDRQTLIASSLVVVFVLTVTALYLGACDFVFAKVFEGLIRP